MKKTKRKRLVEKLDKLFSEYIRRRDGFQCVTCGTKGSWKDGVMQCGHLITRGKHSVRWDEFNAYCQCRGCNCLHEHQPEIFTDLYIRLNGLEMYQTMVQKSNLVSKFKIEDLENMISYYEKKINSFFEI